MIDDLSERRRLYREGCSTHLDALAIVNCGLCDDDGYRGNRVCDHIDHAPAAKRGMAKVRAALAKGGAS